MDYNFIDMLSKILPVIGALSPFTLGLVTLWGKFGVKGNWQLLSSLGTGLVLGGAVLYPVVVPVNYVGWLYVAFGGIANGLVATGVYETAKQLLAKS